MNQHTPGEWAAFEDDNGHECNVLAFKEATTLIARLPVGKRHPNARLIVKAPALLAMLKRALAAEDPDDWAHDALDLLATVEDSSEPEATHP